MPDRTSAYGVYVHVPFCARRCDYCDFATWTDRSHLMADYVEACRIDYLRRAEAGGVRPATSVFFGGGTPSLLPAELLIALLDTIERAPGAEVTVECNPDAADDAKLAAYREAGVTRISVGVQSMDPQVLAALGRTHDPSNVRRVAESAARLGFESWSVDLIYGSPAESDTSWARTLRTVLELGPPHVSAYALTVEPATPMGRRVAAGVDDAPDDDVQARRYEMAAEVLECSGRHWYEISNWARAGHECRHNLGYWNGSECLAIGCAAHGSTDGRRWWTVRSPDRYIDRIRAGGSPVTGFEQLGEEQRAEESFGLALRTRSGVTLEGDARVEREVSVLVDAGAVDRRGGALRLTPKGRLLATDVTARLLAAGAARVLPAGTRYD